MIGPLWRLRHNTARPDIVATNEAQPIEPLLVAEPHCAVLCGLHLLMLSYRLRKCSFFVLRAHGRWVKRREPSAADLPLCPGHQPADIAVMLGPDKDRQ